METNEIRVKERMEVYKAIDYLQAVINSIRSGHVCVEFGDQALTLEPPKDITVQVKARRKEDKESIDIKLSWKTTAEESAAESALRIAATPSSPEAFASPQPQGVPQAES